MAAQVLLVACRDSKSGSPAPDAVPTPTSTTLLATPVPPTRPMTPPAGQFVTETFGYDGGRQVTVYVPPDPAKAVVFAGDGG